MRPRCEPCGTTALMTWSTKEIGSQDECLEEIYLTPAMHGVSEAQTLAPGLLLSALSRVQDTKPVKRSHHKMVTRYDDDDEYHEDDVSDDEEPIKRSRTSKSVDVKVPSSWAPSPWLARADPVDIAAALSQVASAARRRNAVRPRPQPPTVCLPFSRTSGYPRAPETQAGAQRRDRARPRAQPGCFGPRDERGRFPCPAGCDRTFAHAPAAVQHGKRCPLPPASRHFSRGDEAPPPPF